MSRFFQATQEASAALYAGLTPRPYCDFNFHLKALVHFMAHLVRTAKNLAALTLNAVITPFYLLSPLTWLSIPGHLLNLADRALGFSISAITLTIHPLIMTLRTITSILFGYQNGTETQNHAEFLQAASL